MKSFHQKKRERWPFNLVSHEFILISEKAGMPVKQNSSPRRGFRHRFTLLQVLTISAKNLPQFYLL